MNPRNLGRMILGSSARMSLRWEERNLSNATRIQTSFRLEKTCGAKRYLMRRRRSLNSTGRSWLWGSLGRTKKVSSLNSRTQWTVVSRHWQGVTNDSTRKKGIKQTRTMRLLIPSPKCSPSFHQLFAIPKIKTETPPFLKKKSTRKKWPSPLSQPALTWKLKRHHLQAHLRRESN